MTTIKRRIFLFIGSLFLIFAIALGTCLHTNKDNHGLVIGSKNDTEGNILSEIIAQLIEGNTEIEVRRNFFLDGTFLCFSALQAKEIDLYVEYTGTAYSSILKRPIEGKGQEVIDKELKATFLEEYDLVWLDPLGFQNAYVLMMDPIKAEALQIQSLSDLARVVKEGVSLKIAFDPEFIARPECEILKKSYDVSFHHVQILDYSLLHLTLGLGSVDVIDGYATDGLCEGYLILEDDQKSLPTYNATPLIRRETLEKYPELIPLFKHLAGKISEERMAQMNNAVEKKGESVYSVARNFLLQEL